MATAATEVLGLVESRSWLVLFYIADKVTLLEIFPVLIAGVYVMFTPRADNFWLIVDKRPFSFPLITPLFIISFKNDFS